MPPHLLSPGLWRQTQPLCTELNTPLLQLPACPKGGTGGFRLLFNSEGNPCLGTEWSREAGGRQGERPVSRPLGPELFLLSETSLSRGPLSRVMG